MTILIFQQEIWFYLKPIYTFPEKMGLMSHFPEILILWIQIIIIRIYQIIPHMHTAICLFINIIQTETQKFGLRSHQKKRF